MNIDSIHYINLDHRADRRAHIEACLAQAPIKPVRIAAVELDSAPEKQGLSMRAPFQGNRAIASIFLSHRKAIEAALAKSQGGMAIVIEDDCHFPPDIWEKDLGIENLHKDWKLALLNPRFRKHGTPDQRPRLTLLERLNPFRQKYWLKPLKPWEARPTHALRRDYVISGAHFLIFRDSTSLKTALRAMDAISALYHVDHFFCDEMPGCYAVGCPDVHAFGFKSDNHP